MKHYWMAAAAGAALAGALALPVQAQVDLETLCSQFPDNTRCRRVERGEPALTSGVGLPQDNSCVALPVIGGEGTETEKDVSLYRIPHTIGFFLRNNWNTDFAVPEGASYERYIGTVYPTGPGEFDIEMYLKYPDGTSDQVYDVSHLALEDSELHGIEGIPGGTQPYEVNLKVGGPGATAIGYRLSVYGCN